MDPPPLDPITPGALETTARLRHPSIFPPTSTYALFVPPPPNVKTRSRSITSQPAPPAPAAPLPPSALPSVIAVSGYPGRGSLPFVSKTKTPLLALHFGGDPVNSYTGSSVKGKAPAIRPSSSASSASTLSSPNAFAALSDHGETNTVEEQAALDLIGLSDLSSADASGGDISSTEPPSSSPNPPVDPVALIHRRLDSRPLGRAARPSTPPGTTSGAGSSTIPPLPNQPELGPAPPVQYDWEHLDAAIKAPGLVSLMDADSPFLSPLPAVSTSPVPSISVAIADAAAAAGRARQARTSAASASPSPKPMTTQSAPPILPSPAPQPTVPTPQPTIPAPQPAIPALTPATPALTPALPALTPATPALTPAIPAPQPMPAHTPANPATSTPLATPIPTPTAAPPPPAPASPFTTIVTRGAARRAAAAANPAPALPSGMFIPHPPASHAAPHAAPASALPPAGASATQPQPPIPNNPPGANVSTLAPNPVGAAMAAPHLAPPTHNPAGAAMAAPALAAPAQPAVITPGPAAAAAAPGGANIADRQLVKWDSAGVDKFFVYLWNGRRHATNGTALEDLKSALARVLRSPAPLIGPAEFAVGGDHPDSPFVYLVKGVPDAERLRLLAQPCWNLLGGTTFFTIPYSPPPSSFLFTIDGLLYDATDGVEVATLVVDIIGASNEAQTLLALNHDAYPADADTMGHFAASVRVTPIALKSSGSANARVAWNTTAAPPSLDAATNAAWCSLLGKIAYHSDMHFVGHAVRPHLHCTGCKSLGHVVDICPFPQIPGWYAPSTTNSAPAPTPGAVPIFPELARYASYQYEAPLASPAPSSLGRVRIPQEKHAPLHPVPLLFKKKLCNDGGL
ncbi:hypothetical protein B0H17DRAFT_1211045 [Mycena rosella]|uniref:Uncharacterized protein n=1 Tax=Mycena rosella TaxID=1033263 RepID=A0AAD7G857_MYCRO|nr:hypothetical protein B0H17DRAFT_1211045 [Mycena rosella]